MIYKLAISDPNDNWDIYISDDGFAVSKAKKPSCCDSAFGNINHILRLIAEGQFNSSLNWFTEDGLEIFSGLHSRLITDSKGHTFGLLRMSRIK